MKINAMACQHGMARKARQAYNWLSSIRMFRESGVINYVRTQANSVVRQILETREDYRDDFRFYYKVILPVDGFRHGVFVEMRLTGDDDPEYPEVTLFNAHEQRK